MKMKPLAVVTGALLWGGLWARSESLILLNEQTLWRCHLIRGTELVRLDSGELAHLAELSPVVQIKKEGRYVGELSKVGEPRYTVLPPENWKKPEFDDGEWPLLSCPIHPVEYQPWAAIYGRTSFRMPLLKSCGEVCLKVEFHGGVVVYLNGQEVARAYIADGETTPATAARDYGREVFVSTNDILVGGSDTAARGRQRDLLVKLSAPPLREGINVLAVEVHRAPAPEIMFLGKPQPGHHANRFWWPRVALLRACVEVTGRDQADAGQSSAQSIRITAWDVLNRRYVSGNVPPSEAVQRLRIVAARNGVFSGQFLVYGTGQLPTINVAVSDLAGPGGYAIPASAVAVRYPVPDGRASRGEQRWFDSLEEKVVPDTTSDLPRSRFQPVWLSVRIPREVPAGSYCGQVTISSQGTSVVRIPLEVRVSNFVLPDPRSFSTHVGLIESPDSVAMKYRVSPWSEQHWALLEQVFALLATVGNKEVYVPLIRRTHLGNEHGMVRWVKQPDGTWRHDFTVAARYLDVAARHLGRIPVVCLYVWESANATGHFPSGTPEQFRSQDMPIRFTVRDPATGELSEAIGPAWGTEECREFWRPVLAGMQRILSEKGLGESLMFGLSGDFYPSREAVETLAALVPNARWVVHSHTYWEKLRGQPVGCLASVWGISGPRDPATGKDYYGNQRYYGWQNAFVLHLPRAGNFLGQWRSLPLAAIHAAAESCLVSVGRANAKPPGVRGFGRVGADFWEVLPKGAGDRGALTLAGRFPETGWGQLTLNFSEPALLGAGLNGPVTTIRFEILRESLQVAEARVFIEKVLTDPLQRLKLGEELARHCEEVLDERVRDCLRRDWVWYIASGWPERTRQIFELAAQVSACLRGGD